jgi:DNA-binding transcriptional MerR regulator
MQQPPDPGIPGHAAEHTQVIPTMDYHTAAAPTGPGSPAGFAAATSSIGGDVDTPGPGIATGEDVGYRGPTACHAAGISYRQLDYWARTGLVVPSVRDASGSGSQRLYSFRDIVVLKVVKRLLDAGVSLQNIRKAIDTLRSRGVGDLAGITLISDGTTVYECRSPEEVVDLLQGGQGVFGIAISGAFKEIEGTLSHLPAEAATTGEEVPAPPATGSSTSEPFAAGDELAMRRARRRAG